MIDEMMRLIAVVHQGYADCYSKNELDLLSKDATGAPALDVTGKYIKERR